MQGMVRGLAVSALALVVPRRLRGSAVTDAARRPHPVTRGRRLLAMLCDWLGTVLVAEGLLTQEQAAGLLGMSQPGLNAVLRGKSHLSAVGRRFVQHLIADCSAAGVAPQTVAEWRKALNRLAEAMEQELPTEYIDNSYLDNSM